MDTRSDNILNMGEAFDNLKALKLDIQGILRQITVTKEKLAILQTNESELEAALKAKQAEVIEETLCIDRALSQLYPAAPAAAEPEPKKRGRKGREVEASPLEKCDGDHALSTPCKDPQCWHGEDNPLVKVEAAPVIKVEVETVAGAAPPTLIPVEEVITVSPPCANLSPCAACHTDSGCDDCCKECLSGCDAKQECRKDGLAGSAASPASSTEQVGCQKCEGEGWYTGDDGEVNCDCEAGKALTHYEQTELADVPETVPPVAAAVTFTPLSEPHGDCELCHGFGVVEGELYGEPQPVPCICEAGIKVKGGVLPSHCEDCSIEDPDCASCSLLDGGAPLEANDDPVKCFNTSCSSFDRKQTTHCFAAADIGRNGDTPPVTGCKDYRPENLVTMSEPTELPRCANGACTATGKGAKEICLRIGTLGRAPQDCKNFVDVKNCSHHMLKRSEVNGATVCDLCDKVLKPAPEAEPNKLQTKCPHPKPFWVGTADGIMCKVCKTIIEPKLAA